MKYSQHQIHHQGFTALEALIMLLLLTVLALTSLAVYRKQSAQAPGVEIQGSNPSTISQGQDDTESHKVRPNSPLSTPVVPTTN